MSIDTFLSTSHYKERKHNNSFCVCNYCAHNAIICTAELYLTDTLPTTQATWVNITLVINKHTSGTSRPSLPLWIGESGSQETSKSHSCCAWS